MTSIPEALRRLIEGGRLSAPEAEQVVGQLLDGLATPAQAGALLVALRLRGEDAEVLTGGARALRARCVRLEHPFGDVVDTCGTGGDGADSLNLSTLAALVAAGAGVRVAKHGNRSVTSRCGSADLLEALGVRVDVGPGLARRCLEEAGMCFLFAPRYHPVLAVLAPLRRQLGVRTLFNLLGPLANPAGARRQLVGVASPELLEPMARALHRLGAERALVVWGEDGLDEISPCGPTRALELRGGELRPLQLRPEALGLRPCRPQDLRGGDPRQNAEAARRILRGEEHPALPGVLANAAAAIYLGGRAPGLREAVELARDVLRRGRAWAVLERLQGLSLGVEP